MFNQATGQFEVVSIGSLQVNIAKPSPVKFYVLVGFDDLTKEHTMFKNFH